MLELTYHNNLIIGLGGTGGQVLKELRKRIYDELDEIPDGIEFMYVDSSCELMQHDDPTWQTPDGKNAQFFGNEFLDISLKYQTDPLAALPTHFPNLKGIIENCERLKNYRPEAGAMQDRRLGRVLLGLHATEFDRLLKDRVLNLQQQTRSSDLNITVVTGLSGGTGSGCVISVIAHILRLFPDAIITVMATLPTIPPPPMHDTGRYLANAYAALRELNALNIGKLKLTDLVTGEKFQPELPYDRSLDFCHRLQENKLFRLFLFDSFHNEYDKIANILYHNMWLGTGNDAVETYKRDLGMYATIPAPEFNASTEEGEYIEARTRAVGALGLYRIIYPRKPILRHVAYQVLAQSYSQMLFNNYVEGSGYVDTPAHIGCTITDKEQEEWRMAPAYLRLDRDILPQRQRYRTFRDEWEIVGDRALEESLHHDNPLEFMEELFMDYFGKRFRQNGVEEYFQHEANSINDYVGIIASDYETLQLQSWRAGEKGICHLAEQLEMLIETIQRRIDRFPEEIDLCSREIQEYQDTLNQIRTTYQNNLLAKLLQKKKYICQQKECLVQYYYHKTRLRALDFERRLSEVLVIRLRSMQSDLEHLAHCMKEKISRIHDLAQKEKESPADTFYVVDWKWVRWYEDSLCGNRAEIQQMVNVIRMRYAEVSQGALSRLIDQFRYYHAVRDVLPVCLKLVKAYDAMLSFGDKLDKNILSIIEDQYPTKEHLIQATRQAIEKANEHISFNDCEKMKAVRNNPLPNDPWQRPHETILVRIPHATNEREILTSERLAALFKANCGFTNVIIDPEAPETQEISIVSIHTNFPLRCVKSLPDLKQRYDDLISNRGTQAVNMLHTEDAFENLPSLEVEAYTEQQPSQKEETIDMFGFSLPPVL
jgi:hypothetical protein